MRGEVGPGLAGPAAAVKAVGMDVVKCLLVSLGALAAIAVLLCCCLVLRGQTELAWIFLSPMLVGGAFCLVGMALERWAR